MKYRYKNEKFEGPLELLLELIENEKMVITELSLAHVSDQYLDFIKNNEKINLENLADFLSIASKLILIKSRAILPMFQFTEEEKDEIKDLTYQLEEYRRFKLASEKIGKIAGQGRIAYSRESFFGVKAVFFPPKNINAFDLKKFFQLVLAEIPLMEKLEEEIVREVVTLEEKINELQDTILHRIETSFSELTAKAQDKVDIIISFLAMLEMIKQRIVEVEQKDLFKEIKLKTRSAIRGEI